jgi:hypothetical protein
VPATEEERCAMRARHMASFRRVNPRIPLVDHGGCADWACDHCDGKNYKPVGPDAASRHDK